MTGRRDFLKGTLWMGAVAIAGGARCDLATCGGGEMATFAAPPLRKVRVGCVGLGRRGEGAVHRLAQIPGVVITALCDVRHEMVIRQRNYLAKASPPPESSLARRRGRTSANGTVSTSSTTRRHGTSMRPLR